MFVNISTLSHSTVIFSDDASHALLQCKDLGEGDDAIEPAAIDG